MTASRTPGAPALDGIDDDVAARLRAGVRVAGVGCGDGASIIAMAGAFPNSTYYGFDGDEAAVGEARRAARRAGLSARMRFVVATLPDIPGTGYDVIVVRSDLDALGERDAVVRRLRAALAAGGCIVEV